MLLRVDHDFDGSYKSVVLNKDGLGVRLLEGYFSDSEQVGVKPSLTFIRIFNYLVLKNKKSLYTTFFVTKKYSIEQV